MSPSSSPQEKPDQVLLQINPDLTGPDDADRDPGVLTVDDWVTEEQEMQILNDLENELSGKSGNFFQAQAVSKLSRGA
jgi:hypothetical protein